MSLRLVFVGAAAGLAPAVSLRALAGGGAVFVPAGLDGGLRDVIAEAAGAGAAGSGPAAQEAVGPGAAGRGDVELVELDVADDDALAALVTRGRDEDLTVALAGPDGPALARALRARASAGLAPSGSGAPSGPSAARGASCPDTACAVSVVTVPDGAAFDDAVLGQELVSLKRIVDVLRVECPWDREQTAKDIVSYTVEEVYELADAVAADDLAAEHGELGDLLLQVVLLALMLDERGAGDLGSVSHDIEAKLIRRHPHIFADAVAETGAEVRARWDRIKVEQEGREGIFHDVPVGAPALHYARKVQQRASAVGFDWDSVAAAFPKIAEEHAELAEVLGLSLAGETGPTAGKARPAGDKTRPSDDRRRPAGDKDRSAGDKDRLTHEVGDLLFAVVNVARLAGVDPELALRAGARRFERRVCVAAALAEREGRDWAGLGLDEQERYYQRAKSEEGLP